MQRTGTAFHHLYGASMQMRRPWLLPVGLVLAAAAAPQLERLAVDPAVLAGGECLAPAYEGAGCPSARAEGAQNQAAEAAPVLEPTDRFILVADLSGLWAPETELSHGSATAQAEDQCAPASRQHRDRIGCPSARPQRRR